MTDIAAADTFLATHARVLERHRLGAAARPARRRRRGRRRDAAPTATPTAASAGASSPTCARPAASRPAPTPAFELLAELTEHADAGGRRRRARRTPARSRPASPTGPATGRARRRRAAVLAARRGRRARHRAVVGGRRPGRAVAAHHRRDPRDWPTCSGLVGDHPWVEAATVWSLEQVAASRRPAARRRLHARVRARPARRARAARARPRSAELERMAALLPADGALRVSENDEERLRPLRISPEPRRPLRALMPADAIAADLDALADASRDDGGWTVDFPRLAGGRGRVARDRDDRGADAAARQRAVGERVGVRGAPDAGGRSAQARRRLAREADPATEDVAAATRGPRASPRRGRGRPRRARRGASGSPAATTAACGRAADR